MCGVAAAEAPFGLPLPERGGGAAAGAFGVADAAGAGAGSAGALWAVGEPVVGGGISRPKDGLSWGAGEGAIATAVVMFGVRAGMGCAEKVF